MQGIFKKLKMIHVDILGHHYEIKIDYECSKNTRETIVNNKNILQVKQIVNC